MKRSKRFVFDTNVLISAMLFRKGKPRKALNKAIKKGIVTVSDETIKELDETLQYNRFDKYAPLKNRIRSLKLLKKITEKLPVSEAEKVAICRDPDDDKFLTLAKAAKAAAIITGDDDLLVLNPFNDILILSPDEFLKKF